MQRMKSNTAAIGIEKGICKQVIEIDEHRRQHDERGALPTSAKE